MKILRYVLVLSLGVMIGFIAVNRYVALSSNQLYSFFQIMSFPIVNIYKIFGITMILLALSNYKFKKESD